MVGIIYIKDNEKKQQIEEADKRREGRKRRRRRYNSLRIKTRNDGVTTLDSSIVEKKNEMLEEIKKKS